MEIIDQEELPEESVEQSESPEIKNTLIKNYLYEIIYLAFGYINLDKGYFRDINGRWKKKIFIHNSQNIMSLKSGVRISFKISKFKNSLVAINPKIINY